MVSDENRLTSMIVSMRSIEPSASTFPGNLRDISDCLRDHEGAVAIVCRRRIITGASRHPRPSWKIGYERIETIKCRVESCHDPIPGDTQQLLLKLYLGNSAGKELGALAI